ncbi:hypothetical protein GJ744_004033 [Endocarpon pusillum]|uniref:Uncharacterized protein n=1 Tax=Endocarpon pusillum TaxID=364733 RepID=A0A8H7DZE1_9EURO|nr:hypothetical protein GJ744_004033 [Endocarpon pusillum]
MHQWSLEILHHKGRVSQVFVSTDTGNICPSDTQYLELVASIGHTGVIPRLSSLADNKFLPSQEYSDLTVIVPVSQHKPCLKWLHEADMEIDHAVRGLGWNSCDFMSGSQRNGCRYAIQLAVALVYFIWRTADLLTHMARSLAMDKLIWQSYSTYPQWVLLGDALAD